MDNLLVVETENRDRCFKNISVFSFHLHRLMVAGDGKDAGFDSLITLVSKLSKRRGLEVLRDHGLKQGNDECH